jgi:hypothetical protein
VKEGRILRCPPVSSLEGTATPALCHYVTLGQPTMGVIGVEWASAQLLWTQAEIWEPVDACEDMQWGGHWRLHYPRLHTQIQLVRWAGGVKAVRV